MKPSNILIANDWCLKLADFGLARNYSYNQVSLTLNVVTLWYRPIEILLGDNHYSFAVDIWSIGLIFVEMITKIPLF